MHVRDSASFIVVQTLHSPGIDLTDGSSTSLGAGVGGTETGAGRGAERGT